MHNYAFLVLNVDLIYDNFSNPGPRPPPRNLESDYFHPLKGIKRVICVFLKKRMLISWNMCLGFHRFAVWRISPVSILATLCFIGKCEASRNVKVAIQALLRPQIWPAELVLDDYQGYQFKTQKMKKDQFGIFNNIN